MTTSGARRGGAQRIPRPVGVRAGGPAPWAALSPERRRLTLADVRARLASLPPGRAAIPVVDGSVESAVLVPLYESGGETFLVLTKRPETMPSHRGEIAFPGGKFEPGRDADLQAAALREAKEEIDLDPGVVEVVARLEGIATYASRFTIAPFVGFLPSHVELRPNPGEVDRILQVPLSELMADGVYRQERWDLRQSDVAMHFYDLEDETVWGATARILTSLLAHLVDEPFDGP